MPEALLIFVGCVTVAIGIASLWYRERLPMFIRRVGGVNARMAPSRIAQVAKFDRVGSIVLGVWFLVGGSTFVMFGIAMALR
jgi:hypothetical protein